MHEMSIARSILTVVREHAPSGARLQRVEITAGPLRGIDATSMDWAWKALLCAEGEAPADLVLHTEPWHFRCRDCDALFTAGGLDATCTCGSAAVSLVDGNELTVDSIEFEETRNPQLN